jgi:hypothetical protein
MGQRHREESAMEIEYEWCAVNEWGYVRITCETEAEARDVVAKSTTHAGGRVQRRVKPVAIEWEDVP